MKWKLIVGSLVIGASLSGQSFGFDLLNRMLGGSGCGCASTCCDTSVSGPSCGSEMAGCGAAPSCGSEMAGCAAAPSCGAGPSCGAELASCDPCSGAKGCGPSCGAELASCDPCSGAAGCGPTCGAEMASCDPCAGSAGPSCGCEAPRKRCCNKPLLGLLRGIKAEMHAVKCSLSKPIFSCCDNGCDKGCDPCGSAAPSCGAEACGCGAAPSCGAEACGCGATPSCGAETACAPASCDSGCGQKKHCGLLSKLFACHGKKSCDEGACDSCATPCSSCSSPAASVEAAPAAAPAPVVDPSAYMNSKRRVIQVSSATIR